MMKVRKKFVVICYDIADSRKREKIAKRLERYGTRANYSVFECMLTARQQQELISWIEKKLDNSIDRVLYYTICLSCYSKIVKLPMGRDYARLVEIV